VEDMWQELSEFHGEKARNIDIRIHDTVNPEMSMEKSDN
jgi:hypothetical protein